MRTPPPASQRTMDCIALASYAHTPCCCRAMRDWAATWGKLLTCRNPWTNGQVGNDRSRMPQGDLEGIPKQLVRTLPVAPEVAAAPLPTSRASRKCHQRSRDGRVPPTRHGSRDPADQVPGRIFSWSDASADEPAESVPPAARWNAAT